MLCILGVLGIPLWGYQSILVMSRSGLIISFHILPSSSIYSPDIITPFPSSYLRHISCTLLITRTSVLGWCCPVSMPSFLDSFRSCSSYLLLITRTSILGWHRHFVHVLLLLTYLKCCSLVACTLDLTFWVYTALELVFRLLASESSKIFTCLCARGLTSLSFPYIDLWDTESIFSSPNWVPNPGSFSLCLETCCTCRTRAPRCGIICEDISFFRLVSTTPFHPPK